MKQKFLTAGSIFLALGIILSGCTSENETPVLNPGETTENPEETNEAREYKARRAIELTDQTRGVANGLTGFYFDFTADMVRYADCHLDKTEDGNVVVSPLSMAMLMSMVANGAGEQNRADFTGYLGVEDIESLNSLCSILMRDLPMADNVASFELANSIWVNSVYERVLRESYLAAIIDTYRADIRYADFGDGNTLESINKWCAGKTRELIPNFLKSNPEGIALLINVLYFKDAWQGEIFKAPNTHTGIFHGSYGDRNVSFMQGNYTGYYARSNEWEYVTVPFGNAAFQLEVMLPREGREAAVPTAEEASALADKSECRSLAISMPKYRIESRYSISDMLTATGNSKLISPVITMFEGEGISASMRYEQATSFTIDESGVEVTAISDADMIMFGGGETAPIEVKVDRPFWFFIREFSTGACILSGRIANL